MAVAVSERPPTSPDTDSSNVRDLIAVAFCAFENDDDSVRMYNRGISRTLEMAEKMASDLTDMCERLEKTKVET